MDEKSDLPPYLIEVKQTDISKILGILRDNDVLNLVKVTTILRNEYDKYEIDDLIFENPDEKCVSCWFRNKIARDVKSCCVCKRAFCHSHYEICKFCYEPVCLSDVTVSFLFNHSTGDIVCSKCDKAGNNSIDHY